MGPVVPQSFKSGRADGTVRSAYASHLARPASVTAPGQCVPQQNTTHPLDSIHPTKRRTITSKRLFLPMLSSQYKGNTSQGLWNNRSGVATGGGTRDQAPFMSSQSSRMRTWEDAMSSQKHSIFSQIEEEFVHSQSSTNRPQAMEDTLRNDRNDQQYSQRQAHRQNQQSGQDPMLLKRSMPFSEHQPQKKQAISRDSTSTMVYPPVSPQPWKSNAYQGMSQPMTLPTQYRLHCAEPSSHIMKQQQQHTVGEGQHTVEGGEVVDLPCCIASKLSQVRPQDYFYPRCTGTEDGFELIMHIQSRQGLQEFLNQVAREDASTTTPSGKDDSSSSRLIHQMKTALDRTGPSIEASIETLKTALKTATEAKSMWESAHRVVSVFLPPHRQKSTNPSSEQCCYNKHPATLQSKEIQGLGYESTFARPNHLSEEEDAKEQEFTKQPNHLTNGDTSHQASRHKHQKMTSIVSHREMKRSSSRHRLNEKNNKDTSTLVKKEVTKHSSKKHSEGVLATRDLVKGCNFARDNPQTLQNKLQLRSVQEVLSIQDKETLLCVLRVMQKEKYIEQPALASHLQDLLDGESFFAENKFFTNKILCWKHYNLETLQWLVVLYLCLDHGTAVPKSKTGRTLRFKPSGIVATRPWV